MKPLKPTEHSLPYGRQCIDSADIAAVVDVLKSSWITTGPKVDEFERALAKSAGVPHAVALCNGTAALHTAMHAIGIGPGDEVIVSCMSFAASANCVVFQGGVPVFADVLPDSLLINPADVERKITPQTKAIIAVDYAGMPCDYDVLRALAQRYKLRLVADACHAIGASYRGHAVGALADITAFSFHPVKNMTTGEGGALLMQDEQFARNARIFRNHGIMTSFRERQESGIWEYDMAELGWNYRITDFQCALGLSQLKKLPAWILRRNEIASFYDDSFLGLQPDIRIVHPPALLHSLDIRHGRHLYVIRAAAHHRASFFAFLREKGLGVNVHYRPIHLHSFYRNRYGTYVGQCPVAEQAYQEILSLPLFPGLSDAEAAYVVDCVREFITAIKPGG